MECVGYQKEVLRGNLKFIFTVIKLQMLLLPVMISMEELCRILGDYFKEN